MLILFSLSFSSAKIVCNVYDDFNLGNLNLESWSELPYGAYPFADEHFVDVDNGIYRVRQFNGGGAGVSLEPKRFFSDGDKFSYEVTYVSGAGNFLTLPLINNKFVTTLEQVCDFAYCGAIGYWNSETDLGFVPGTYSINYEFFKNSVKMTTVKPDGDVVINNFIGVTEPFILDFSSRTDSNGLMDLYFDNFKICTLDILPAEIPMVPEFSFFTLVLVILGGLIVVGVLRR